MAEAPEGLPTITVITVCRDAEGYIEQTIQSVTTQSYPNIEYIIVDGASKDGTLDIIGKYAEKITRWISEPDQGIADAMNKGLALASGELVLFLHADDYFVDPGVLDTVASRMSGDWDIYACNIFFDRSGFSHRRRPRLFDWRMNFKTGLLHQGLFCRRRLFDEIGPFDTQFKIAMDYEFFLRAYRRGATLKLIDLPLVVMRDTGVSSRTDWPSLRERFLEEKQVQRKHSKGPLMRGMYFVYWMLYMPYRWVRSAPWRG